ncbi:MAG: DUF952 domain-containing protein [Pirellulales bacterium]|nr:DUF952 domain-containing protein [Pirellulales bacterium]
MGFHVEINSILRTDEPYELARGSEHPFRKTGSRVFFDTLPIWLAKSDWTALAEIRVIQQSRTHEEVSGRFRVLHVYGGEAQQTMTVALRRMYAAGDDPFIYLLLSPADYQQAKQLKEWSPPSLGESAFIHASPRNQLTRVANKYYAEHDTVYVLLLRHEKVSAEVRWEPATGGLYPHIYGPLNMNAAERVVTVSRGANGKYSIGPELFDSGTV